MTLSMRSAEGESLLPSLLLDLSKRFQCPCIVCRGHTVPKDVEIAIIGAYLEKRIIWAVPLIEYFLDHEESRAQMKSHRPLLCLPAGIAFNSELHIQLSTHNCAVGPSLRGAAPIRSNCGETLFASAIRARLTWHRKTAFAAAILGPRIDKTLMNSPGGASP